MRLKTEERLPPARSLKINASKSNRKRRKKGKDKLINHKPNRGKITKANFFSSISRTAHSKQRKKKKPRKSEIFPSFLLLTIGVFLPQISGNEIVHA
jgi:hypothetical protein